jgi:hypothetical protein
MIEFTEIKTWLGIKPQSPTALELRLLAKIDELNLEINGLVAKSKKAYPFYFTQKTVLIMTPEEFEDYKQSKTSLAEEFQMRHGCVTEFCLLSDIPYSAVSLCLTSIQLLERKGKTYLDKPKLIPLVKLLQAYINQQPYFISTVERGHKYRACVFHSDEFVFYDRYPIED